MPTILIVDDRPTNRHFLVTLLSYGGHTLLEAADGAEAIEFVRNQQPDLIITDILMPTMDGYEFVRQLRADPNFANIPVIFYTATYRDREARSLAKAAGVQYVLTKPAEPQAILNMVNAALGHLQASTQAEPITRPISDPVQVVSTKLASKMGELDSLGRRLEALVELVLKIASEREPERLLEIACDSARVIVNAEYAAIGMLEEGGQSLKHFVTSGMDSETIARIGSPPTGKGVLGKLLAEGRPLRLSDISSDPDSVGFPPSHPEMRSFLGVPLASPTGLYGRLYLTEKIGASEFSEQDERVAVALGAQVAVAYENAYRYDEIQRHAANLQMEISERKRAEEALRVENERFQRFIESNIVGIVIADPIGKVIAANDYYLGILGVTQQEFLEGKVDWRKFTPAEWLPADEKAIQELRERGICEPYEKEYERADGTRVPVFLADAMLPGPEEQIAAFVLDITERKQAEAKIENQLQRLSALRAIDLMITSSFDLRVTLEAILQHIVTRLHVDAAAVLIFNQTSMELEFAAGQGFLSSGITQLRLRLGEEFAGRAALERRLIHIPDLSQAVHRLSKPELLANEGFVSLYAVPLVAKEKVKGVLEVFHRSRLDPDIEWLDFLHTLAGQTAIAIDNAELFNDLQRSNSDLILAYDATIEGWSRALDLRDRETEGHTQRVTEMAMRLASAMGISKAELVHVRRGCLLHDIGKMGVPDHILLKPEALTDEEWDIMRRHPRYAFEMLLPITFLHPALDIPYCHHEKLDGTGYPRGLKDEEIPFIARVFAVVDVWDALLSDRPYRPAWTKEKARGYIRENNGTHFDPQVVEMFLSNLADLIRD
jgi:PAS domain S-box-containing protein/putative nucleotidyltransferase with HDIG domain